MGVHRSAAVAAGLAASAWILALAPPARAQEAPHRVCFYVDNSGVTGHAYVQIVPPFMGCACENPDAGRMDLAFGKYSTQNNVLRIAAGATPGEIKHDARRRWHRRICFDITLPQYNAMVAKVRFERAKTPPYHLKRNPPGNCVHWMREFATLGGITLPSSRDAVLGTESPSAFFASLGAIGDGNMYNPGNGRPIGLVEYNANLNIGPDGQPIAANPPRDVDATAAAHASVDDPAAAADAMVLPLAQSDLGTLALAPGGVLSLNLANANADETLITIDWGDASPREHESLSFTHVYASPGLRNVRVGVIDTGAVNFYTLHVQVIGGGPSFQEIEITVPTPTPGTVPNPGFELTFDPAFSTPIAVVPTMGQWALLLLALGFGFAGAGVIGRWCRA